MPIRPSFIATRRNGVETYRFSHLSDPFTIRPDGRFWNVSRLSDDFESPCYTRTAAVAFIMAAASLSL